MKDSGSSYSYHDNGYTYGWLDGNTLLPTDFSKNARNRNLDNLDAIHNTLIHMQHADAGGIDGISSHGIWEMNLPNGSYEITALVGDGGIDDKGTVPAHTINAEGVKIIDRYRPTGSVGSATRFKKASGIVVVEDNKLTIDAEGGFNTKINALEIIPINDPPIIQDQEFEVAQDNTGGYNQFSITVEANDLDGDNLNFAIKSGNNNGFFKIDKLAGVISDNTYEHLDIGVYRLIVEVSDGHHSSSASITINVISYNTSNYKFLQFNFASYSNKSISNYMNDQGYGYHSLNIYDPFHTLTFGWLDINTDLPINLHNNLRDRNLNMLDNLHNTFMHMQYDDANDIYGRYGVPVEGYWELEMPNGVYEVTVSVGDGLVDNENPESHHTINAEGINIINNFISSGEHQAPSR
ncbi:MAG: cadherin repeat domain-containing protein, partial [Leeuwenhoekiella sp.]